MPRRNDEDISDDDNAGLDGSEEGARLPGNPRLREPVASTPEDRTSMIDLEAVEAKRAARRAEADAQKAAEASSFEAELTPPPDEDAPRDHDATGTMARGKGKRRDGTRPGVKGNATRTGMRARPDDKSARGTRPGINGEMSLPDAAVYDEDDAAEEADDDDGEGADDGRRERSRVGTRTGMKGGTAMRARPATKRKPLSPAAAAAIVALAIVAMLVVIIVVVRASAVLTVTSVPAGAVVKLDGEPIGASPVQKRVKTGQHVVELELAGFEPFREIVDVSSAGLPFVQPLKALPPPPPPPPTPAEIADDLAAQAQRLFDAGDVEGASAKVKALESVMPDHAASAALRAKVKAAQDVLDSEKRKGEASAARAAQMARARAACDEGKRLYDAGHLGAARDKLFEALKLDAGYPEPHRALAKIFNRDNEVDKVRYHLDRYLTLGGEDRDFKVREWLKAHPK